MSAIEYEHITLKPIICHDLGHVVQVCELSHCFSVVGVVYMLK